MRERERRSAEAAVESLEVSAFTIPTDQPESDGTLAWDSTTIVVVEARSNGLSGLGYTYGEAAIAPLIESKLAEAVRGRDAFQVQAAWLAMFRALRNSGRRGLVAMAIAAVDIALWDLKARLLEAPLVHLLGGFRDRVPVYGSGGFTSYSLERLEQQTSEWVAEGIPRVKIKMGRDPAEDPERLGVVRRAIGDGTELYADANGALGRKQALAWCERLVREWDVCWFEEPVSSADLAGLRLLRDRGPAGLEIAAGEYCYLADDFRLLLEAQAVDCLQADVSRCAGITGLLSVGALAAAHGVDLSAHCVPALSAHAFCALERVRHLEYFHDHVRIERMLFDGCPELVDGSLRPDLGRAGTGMELRRDEAARFAVS